MFDIQLIFLNFQMSLFCLCTSFACLFDYIFTFTLLAPILYLADKSGNSYLMAEKVPKNEVRYFKI